MWFHVNLSVCCCGLLLQKFSQPPAAKGSLTLDRYTPSVLQLGMNCSNRHTALKVVSILQQLLQLEPFPTSPASFAGPGASSTHGIASDNRWARTSCSLPGPDVCKLFITAAVRRHLEALRQMAAMPAVMQCVDAGALCVVLQQLVAAKDVTSMELVLEALQKTAVQKLSNESMIQLLLAAVAEGRTAGAEQLYALPAAQRLPASSVAQLLAAILKHLDVVGWTLSHALAPHVLALPAAQRLTADMVAQLLHAALQQPPQGIRALDGRGFVLQLFKLPAAQDLISNVLHMLLHTALKHEPPLKSDGAHIQAEIVKALCRLPAAQQLDVEVAQQLMATGEQPRHGPCKLALLQNLPVAPVMLQVRARALAARLELARSSGAQLVTKDGPVPSHAWDRCHHSPVDGNVCFFL
jgi:hypothetical protein